MWILGWYIAIHFESWPYLNSSHEQQIKFVLKFGGGGGQPLIEQELTYFSNHEDDIQS